MGSSGINASTWELGGVQGRVHARLAAVHRGVALRQELRLLERRSLTRRGRWEDHSHSDEDEGFYGAPWHTRHAGADHARGWGAYSQSSCVVCIVEVVWPC